MILIININSVNFQIKASLAQLERDSSVNAIGINHTVLLHGGSNTVILVITVLGLANVCTHPSAHKKKHQHARHQTQSYAFKTLTPTHKIKHQKKVTIAVFQFCRSVYGV